MRDTCRLTFDVGYSVTVEMVVNVGSVVRAERRSRVVGMGAQCCVSLTCEKGGR